MRVLLTLSVALLLSACSGSTSRRSDPDLASFAVGTCRDAAPGVIALRHAAQQLGSGPTVPTAVLQAIERAQQQILPMSTNPDPVGKQVLFLFQEAGFTRLQGVGNSYDAKVGATLLSAADAFVTGCTTPVPTPSAP